MAIFKGQKDQITVNVTAEVLTDNNRIMRVPFKATYRQLPASEVEDLAEQEKQGVVTTEGIVRANLLGWSDLRGEDNEPIEFTPENLDTALQIMAYKLALYHSFLRAQYGQKAVNVKN